MNNLRFWAKTFEKVQWRFAVQSCDNVGNIKKKSRGVFWPNFCVWDPPKIVFTDYHTQLSIIVIWGSLALEPPLNRP